MTNEHTQSTQPQPPREVAFSLPHALFAEGTTSTTHLCDFWVCLENARQDDDLFKGNEPFLEVFEDRGFEFEELNSPVASFLEAVEGRWLQKAELKDLPKELPICRDVPQTLAVLSRVRRNRFRPDVKPDFSLWRFEKGVFVMETNCFDAAPLDNGIWPDELVYPHLYEFPRCPYCNENDGCPHLLANIDFTFGEVVGGRFCHVHGPSLDSIKEAVTKLRASGTPLGEALKRLEKDAPDLLQVLKAQIADEGEDPENWSYLSHHAGEYIDGMLWYCGAVSKPYDFDSEAGYSYSGEAYYAKDADKAAQAALEAVRADCRLLLGK